MPCVCAVPNRFPMDVGTHCSRCGQRMLVDITQTGGGCTTCPVGFTFDPSHRCDACRRGDKVPTKEHRKDDR